MEAKQETKPRQYKMAIRREEFNKWERRCSLTPKDCQRLLQKMGPTLTIKVQPSNLRIFADSEWVEAGCELSEEIEDCDLIIGVKQVPCEKLIEGKTFMFFSHTIKAQEGNMEMLDEILKKKIRLIDYERICGSDGKRLVAFGRFAGNAGAIGLGFLVFGVFCGVILNYF